MSASVGFTPAANAPESALYATNAKHSENSAPSGAYNFDPAASPKPKKPPAATHAAITLSAIDRFPRNFGASARAAMHATAAIAAETSTRKSAPATSAVTT